MHGPHAVDADRGGQAPSKLERRIDATSLLQTRVEMSTDSEADGTSQRGAGRPLVGHEHGLYLSHAPLRKPKETMEINLQKSPWSRPREIEIDLQGRLDSKAVPFKRIAGLSDDLDILPEAEFTTGYQRGRQRHDRRERQMQLQQMTTQAPIPQSGTQAPAVQEEEMEVPRMALTDYKSYRQAMVNFGDVQYISYITIGRQTISGILDTGSFELVVFSSVCQSCGQAAKYDAGLSKSYTAGKLASGQSYGSGETTSLEAFDKIAIGPFDESNQTFWEVFDAHMPILHHAAFQSIIGVGPPETPAADAWANAKKASDNLTAFYNVGKRAPTDARQRLSNKITIAKEMSSKSTMLKTFKVQMFSVCVGARPGSDGYFIWNDTSAIDARELFWRVPVVGKHTWSVQLRHVRLEGADEQALAATGQPQEPMSLGCGEDGCGALVDSGTSLLAVPTMVINKLLQYLENMGANCSRLDTLPDLVFEMNGMRLSLPPDSYVAEVKGGVPAYLQSFVSVRTLTRVTGQCQLVLMESFADSAYGPLWILGVPFFRKYYTTFSIGERKQDRSIFIASASEDCEPVNLTSPDVVGAQPYHRRIDPSKLYVPATVMAAATEEFVHL